MTKDHNAQRETVKKRSSQWMRGVREKVESRTGGSTRKGEREGKQ